jgi:hypothetical protein
MRTRTIALLVTVSLAGCASPSEGSFGGAEWNGGSGGGASSGSSGAGSGGSATGSSSGGGSTGGSSSGSGGGTSSSDGGGGYTPPPPSQPAQPGGFQQTVAPLLDAAGCTECHHHGRPIDLTTYPFMAGSASDTAAQLVGAFTKGMPPAPRTPAAQSVVDQVNAWIAAGMKP